MQLQDLTDQAIKQFAGSVIFDRGYNYYVNKLVYELRYDSNTDRIQAQVSGHYGDYDVNVTAQSGHLSATCNCPYDGYPCKHVVAVLLTFIHNRNTYIQQAKASQKAESSLTKKVKALSKDALVEMLLSYSKKYPDVKRDLMVRLGSDKKATFSSIKRQIAEAFPSVESYNYSTYNIAKQLQAILKSVENASSEMQIKVYWAVIDRTLEELDAYGMQDETLEGVAIDTMEDLVEAFADIDSFQEEKAEIIEQLMKYYRSGNFGITDWVYDTAVGLCKEKSDYKIVIKSLERQMKGNSFASYHQAQIADLYAAIGNTDAQRKTLEANLQYGMDYWRLAEYWAEQGNEEKALEIVNEGLEKGKGRKVELYEALQKYYQKHKEYDRIFELFQGKVEKNELDHGRSFKLDSTYQWLWNHYTKQKNYEGNAKLLEIRLLNNDIDLDFYKQAEKTLHATDWQEFESKIINNLEQRIQERQQQRKQSYGLYYHSFYATSEITILAEIYFYKNDHKKLFETVKDNIDLLQKYESLLMPHYTEEYLKQYRKKIDQLIKARGRNNYQAAVPYAKTLKHLYTKILQKPEQWTHYITHLRQEHKKLRAFQDEFKHL